MSTAPNLAHLPFDYRLLDPAEADGEPGWYSWNMIDPTRYNTVVLGRLRVRREDTAHGARCRLRMIPERHHTNLLDNIHGGTTLGLIDIALFATMHVIGSGAAGPSVTVELSTQFVAAGDPARALDAVTEIVAETPGMLFVRGQCVQASEQEDDTTGERVVASYSGIVRKRPVPSAAPNSVPSAEAIAVARA